GPTARLGSGLLPTAWLMASTSVFESPSNDVTMSTAATSAARANTPASVTRAPRARLVRRYLLIFISVRDVDAAHRLAGPAGGIPHADRHRVAAVRRAVGRPRHRHRPVRGRVGRRAHRRAIHAHREGPVAGRGVLDPDR